MRTDISAFFKCRLLKFLVKRAKKSAWLDSDSQSNDVKIYNQFLQKKPTPSALCERSFDFGGRCWLQCKNSKKVCGLLAIHLCL